MTDNSKKLLKSFVLDIVKVFPEYEKRLSKSYSKILNEEDDCDDIAISTRSFAALTASELPVIVSKISSDVRLSRMI